MSKPTLRKGVKLRKGVTLAPDNSLNSRRERYQRVPKNVFATSSRYKQYKAIKKRVYMA